VTLVYTPKRLAQAAPTGTSDSTIYTVPGGELAIIKQIMISNVVAGSITVAVSVVPLGGTAGISNRVVPDTTLSGKSVLVFDLSQVMDTGDFISVKTSSANAATFTISGVETTVAELPAVGLQLALNDFPVGVRPRLNLHESQFIDLTVTDDAVSGEVDITITALPQAYVHTQGSPANPWVINHNLGFYPNAVVIDSGGSNVEGDVTYPSVNQMQIAFSGAFSGVAYLS
jgi:hypothetical protein